MKAAIGILSHYQWKKREKVIVDLEPGTGSAGELKI